LLAIWYAHALLDEVPAAVKDDQRGNTPYAILLRSLAPYLAHNVEPENRCLTPEVLLYPIHDGLGHQAGRSSVAVKLDDNRLPLGEKPVEFAHRCELCALGSQEDKCGEQSQ